MLTLLLKVKIVDTIVFEEDIEIDEFEEFE
jgi:hypothetical protein